MMDSETQAEVTALRLLASKAAREKRLPAAIGYYRDVLRILPRDFDTLVALGDLCARAGDRKDQSISYYSRALKLQPQNQSLVSKRNELFQERVRAWHFRMMNDEQRNAGFYQAIKKVVTPDSIVMDIGTGSGILAMMAARAGARHVYTIEANGTIGDMAREIIAAHGLSSKITVLSPYYSTEVRFGYDIQEQGDILTVELLGNDTLAEGILSVMSDARRRLLQKNATLIPNKAKVFGLLVESPEAYKLGNIQTVSGFDLSPFNLLLGERDCGDLIRNYSHRLLSDPFEMFHFDFHDDTDLPEEKEIEVLPTADGLCHLILKWQRIYADDENPIDTWQAENPPECPAWLQKFAFCPTPIPIEKGKPVRILAGHDTTRVTAKVIR